jgi:hypothetical protein
MKVRDTKLCGQRLLLSNVDVNFLGPNLILDECEVHSDCENKALVISGLTMSGGRFFQQSHTLVDFHFQRAHFAGVQFIGSLAGCTFGDWDSVQNSSIQGCDFTEAKLADSRFLNCDVKSIRFPKWPGFTLVQPSAARDFVLSRPWPSKTRIALDVYTDHDPECVAICGDAAQLAKSDDVLLNELRALLQRIPGIQIID